MVLQISLQAAVPLWIAEHRGSSEKFLRHRADECAQVVAEKGDVLMYGGGKSKSGRDGCREAFNRLAEGLAIAVLMVGEVRWLDLHFTRDSL